MKPFTKIAAVALCLALFTGCAGRAADASAAGTASLPAQSTQQLSQLEKAKQQNPDTAAWLCLPGTDVDDPVMQTANNEDYLRHNEKGEADVWGCYFADYYSVLIDRTSLQQNTVIYGHSDSSEDPNGKRFTQLFHYLDLDFLQQNQNIYLTVGDETLTFQIIAVFFTDTDFYYIDPQPSDQGFDAFKKTIAEKNEFVFGTNLNEQDKLLTLSACAYRYDTENTGDQRLVVMAKLLPAGETPQAVSIAANPNPQRP